MSALNKALSHITHGTAYSWDLTVLLSFGIPVSAPLRQKMLSGATTQADADHLRALLHAQQKSRVEGMENTRGSFGIIGHAADRKLAHG